MKNVKILLLLGVMLVNVMPYINNGKVEWKAAQAEAQYFYIETLPNGNELCGLWLNGILTYGESSEPCEWLSYYNYPGAIPDNGDSRFDYSIGNIHDVSSPSSKWCAFCILQALNPIKSTEYQPSGSTQNFGESSTTPNSDPTPYAKLYFGNIYSDAEMLNHGIDFAEIPKFYSEHGINVGQSVSTNSNSDLVNGIDGDGKGLLIVDMVREHAFIMSRIHGKKSDLQNAQCEFYDPWGVETDRALKDFDFVTNNWNMIISK